MPYLQAMPLLNFKSCRPQLSQVFEATANNKGITFIPASLLRISLAGLHLSLCELDWQRLGYLLLQTGVTHLGFL